MTIKVLVNGAFGHMGQIASKAVENDPELELVGQTGREYDLKKAILDSKADVVIDFTEPASVYKNTLVIIEANVHPVIGTSGLKPDQIKELQHRCEKIKLGGIIAPNFSLGAVLMMKCAQEIARYIPRVEIIELHHDTKVDSPSGTAIRTAQMLVEAIGDNKIAASHETLPGARGANLNGVAIHSIRLPGFLAHQQVIFGNPGETLTIKHDAIDRQSFIPGIQLACRKVQGLSQLVYGLEGIL